MINIAMWYTYDNTWLTSVVPTHNLSMSYYYTSKAKYVKCQVHLCHLWKNPAIYHAFFIYCAAEVFFSLFTYSFIVTDSIVLVSLTVVDVYFRILQACKWFVGTTDTVVRMHILAAQAVSSKVTTSITDFCGLLPGKYIHKYFQRLKPQSL